MGGMGFGFASVPNLEQRDLDKSPIIIRKEIDIADQEHLPENHYSREFRQFYISGFDSSVVSGLVTNQYIRIRNNNDSVVFPESK